MAPKLSATCREFSILVAEQWMWKAMGMQLWKGKLAFFVFPVNSALCVLGPSGTARLPVNVCCFQREKFLITIWMVRGLGMGFISTSELTVPQVGSSSGKVSQQPFAALPDGCVRKGGQKSRRTRCKGGAGSSGPWRLSSTVPRCCPAAGALHC